MSLSSSHESQTRPAVTHKPAPRIAIANYMTDGEMRTISMDLGTPDGNDRLRKLAYWAMSNGVEIRLRPVTL